MKNSLKGVGSLERIVYHTMVDGRGRLRKGYARLLNPFGKYRHDQYPANQIGLLARLEKPLQDMHIKLGEIEDLVRNDRAYVQGMYSPNLIHFVRKVIARIGMESYNVEWRNRESQIQLKEKIEASTDITLLANRMLSEMAERHVIAVFKDIMRDKTHPRKKDFYTVMDLGCGMHAATIGNHLEKLHDLAGKGLIPKRYSDYVRVLLVDVDPHATHKTADMISNPNSYKHLGFKFSSPREVHCFNMNFNELATNPALMDYTGLVDTGLSGAAPCHVTEKDEFFSMNRKLCSHRGAFFMWDWLAKTFAAQYLRLPRIAPGCILFEASREIPERHEVYTFEDIDAIPDDFYEKLKGTRWRSIYELREEDVAPHLANMDAWLGYWGYRMFDDSEECFVEKQVNGMGITEFHRKLFHMLIEKERGYNPIHDFVIGSLSRGRRSDLMPFDTGRVAYNFIESYGIEVSRMMRKAGFEAYDIPFAEAMDLARTQNLSGEFNMNADDLNETQKVMMPALNFSVAYDDKDYLDELLR
jgi:hypothetical protein